MSVAIEPYDLKNGSCVNLAPGNEAPTEAPRDTVGCLALARLTAGSAGQVVHSGGRKPQPGLSGKPCFTDFFANPWRTGGTGLPLSPPYIFELIENS